VVDRSLPWRARQVPDPVVLCVHTLAHRLISVLMHADMILMVLDASKADIQKRLLIAVR